MGANGAGQVEVRLALDDEANKAFANLDEQFRDSDLQRAGWVIAEPNTIEGASADGAVKEYVMSRGFSSPGEANQVLEQLTGDDGPFQNFQLQQHRNLLSVDSTFSGTVDLTDGIESFGNESLLAQTGRKIGIDANEAVANAGGDANKVFPVEVAVNLPGSPSRVQPAQEGDSWKPQYGTKMDLAKTNKGLDTHALLLLVMSAAALGGALLVVIKWRDDFRKARPFGRHGAGAGQGRKSSSKSS